jgi:predicted metal-dependent HD superfamily phosphohydrolase
MEERWRQLWQKLKFEPPSGVWAELSGLYQAPDRYYHNLTHISACLELLDLGQAHPSVGMAPDQHIAIELAIWFHDAIYDTHATDNEQQSAALASTIIQETGLNAELADQVHRLVLATGHGSNTIVDEDTQLLLDIDLAILGSEPHAFWAYESQIRQEYAWVPLATFQQKRAAVLQTFFDRANIYQTKFYREMLETNARANLVASVDQLANK